jgi:peptidoglycan/xylan/chitin deacetylase (PgdA/CDA1 family)
MFGKDAAVEQVNLRTAAGTGDEFHPKVIQHIHETVMLGLRFVIGLDSATHVPFNSLESSTHRRDVMRAQRILDDKVGNRINVSPHDAASQLVRLPNSRPTAHKWIVDESVWKPNGFVEQVEDTI